MDGWLQPGRRAIYSRARNGKVDPGSLDVGDTRAPGVVWDALLRKSIDAMAFFIVAAIQMG